jgi:hypothetical protein
MTTLIPGTSIGGPLYYRQLDANGDYSFGNSAANWWGFQPEGVAQSVLTRLQLQVGDWFLNTKAGMPWTTKVLGKSSARTRNMVIKARVLSTQYVTGISDYAATLNPNRQNIVSFTLTSSFSTVPIAVQSPL